VHPKEGGIAEIGYWVRSDRTRRGYATAAADALTTAPFDYLSEVMKVIIRMDKANLASAALPPRLGYTLEGEEILRDVVTTGHTGEGWNWAQPRPPNPAGTESGDSICGRMSGQHERASEIVEIPVDYLCRCK